MNQQQLSELRSVILNIPELSPKILNGDDVGIASYLNTTQVSRSKQTEAWLAKKLLIKSGKWRGIVAACNAGNSTACVVVDLAEDSRMTVDFMDDTANELLNGLILSGLISDVGKEEIQALSLTNISLAESIVGQQVTHLDVAYALRVERGW